MCKTESDIVKLIILKFQTSWNLSNPAKLHNWDCRIFIHCEDSPNMDSQML